MPSETPDPTSARRDAILQSAAGVFLRYGYRKTSMDDLARAADLSRQGLYLHFANKEALFKEVVVQLIGQSRATMRSALARDALPIEERLLVAFMALKSQGDGSEMPQEHLAELFATATQLVGPVLDELEQAMVADLSRVLQASGVAAGWKEAGLGAKDLALHLTAASHGIKHQAKSTAEYRERMRVAIRLVCRVPAPVSTRR
jgi:AcrR family transcriptional regulator